MDRKDIDPVLGIFLSALPIAAADQGSATIGLRVNRTLAAELKTVRLQNVFTVRHTTQGCGGGERLTEGQGGGLLTWRSTDLPVSLAVSKKQETAAKPDAAARNRSVFQPALPSQRSREALTGFSWGIGIKTLCLR